MRTAFVNDAANTKEAKQRRHWGPWKLLIPALILLCAGGTLGLVLRTPGKIRQNPTTEAPPVNVEVEVVAPLPELADTFELPAVVEANRVVTVSAEVEGRIERVAGEEGRTCRAGDPLIHINTDLLQAQCDQIAAQAQYDRTRFQRISNLHQEGATTRDELDAASAAMGVSQAALEACRVRLDRSTIVAPTSGVLNSVPVEEGEYLQAGDVVAEIVDLETVKVVVQVPERDVQYMAKGAQVQVSLDVGGREQELTGAITYISELADEQTRTTRLEVSVENRSRLLRSGQLVRVKLTRRVLTDVVMVPLAAVIPLENAYAVYLVEDGTAQRREVELGLIRGRRIQILSGLQPGDRLIVVGQRFVGPGQAVKVVTAP